MLSDSSQLEQSEVELTVTTSQKKSALHPGIELKNGPSDVELAVDALREEEAQQSAQLSAPHQDIDPRIGLSDIERAVADLNDLNDRYTRVFSKESMNKWPVVGSGQ